mmetsp:Transcript_28483/g.46251  ORF Transcript_28483/g.46251 Transcript_28483/m.46251 type:complete len:221 (-) Transcript_28483:293-955(-)
MLGSLPPSVTLGSLRLLRSPRCQTGGLRRETMFRTTAPKIVGVIFVSIMRTTTTTLVVEPSLAAHGGIIAGAATATAATTTTLGFHGRISKPAEPAGATGGMTFSIAIQNLQHGLHSMHAGIDLGSIHVHGGIASVGLWIGIRHCGRIVRVVPVVSVPAIRDLREPDRCRVGIWPVFRSRVEIGGINSRCEDMLPSDTNVKRFVDGFGSSSADRGGGFCY